MASKHWMKGRGKLGVFEPLIGTWHAEADSPLGRVACRRTFSRGLGGHYVLLDAYWELPGKTYDEHAIYGLDDAGAIVFWSFTSDGKRSQGTLCDGSDVHPEALAFEARMPAGFARMIHWPDGDGGFRWAVESKTRKGWNRFTEHQYRRP